MSQKDNMVHYKKWHSIPTYGHPSHLVGWGPLGKADLDAMLGPKNELGQEGNLLRPEGGVQAVVPQHRGHQHLLLHQSKPKWMV